MLCHPMCMTDEHSVCMSRIMTDLSYERDPVIVVCDSYLSIWCLRQFIELEFDRKSVLRTDRCQEIVIDDR